MLLAASGFFELQIVMLVGREEPQVLISPTVVGREELPVATMACIANIHFMALQADTGMPVVIVPTNAPGPENRFAPKRRGRPPRPPQVPPRVPTQLVDPDFPDFTLQELSKRASYYTCLRLFI